MIVVLVFGEFGSCFWCDIILHFFHFTEEMCINGGIKSELITEVVNVGTTWHTVNALLIIAFLPARVSAGSTKHICKWYPLLTYKTLILRCFPFI